MKFYFRAQNIQVSLPGVDIAGKLVLVWKRGPRRTVTEPFPVKETLSNVDGSLSRTAATAQDLALICTMFKTRTGAFESKTASLVLREETPEGEERKLGTASIDLASYATPEPSNESVELEFDGGSIKLNFTLSSHWLKQMHADGDDDAASMSSLGSFASSAQGHHSGDDLDVSDHLRSEGARHRHHMAGGGNPFGSGGGGGGGGSGGGGGGGGGGNPFGEAAPADADSTAVGSARERLDAARNAAVERRWDQAAGQMHAQEEVVALRAELKEANAARAQAEKDVKSLKGRVDRLQTENRVLRREQRGGKRDEVVLQLETELVAKEQERAEMEEQLSRAFGSVIGEAHERIGKLTTEREALMIKLEESSHSHRRGHGFLGK